MVDLAEFMKARFHEIDPDHFHDRTECDLNRLAFLGDCSCKAPELVRRMLEAQWRLIEEYEAWLGHETAEFKGDTPGLRTALGHLARVYTTHPDHQDRWNPR